LKEKMWYNLFIDIIFLFGGYSLWNISELLKLVIFATVQRTAVAANARPLASPLARPAAASLTSSAKAQRKASNQKFEMPPTSAAFSM